MKYKITKWFWTKTTILKELEILEKVFKELRKRRINYYFLLRDWLQRNSWDVIPLVCEYITVQIEETGPHLVQCCQVNNKHLVHCKILSCTKIFFSIGRAKENLIDYNFTGVASYSYQKRNSYRELNSL